MTDNTQAIEQTNATVGHTSVKSSLACFLAAFIWGTAFVAQKVGGDTLSPIVFNTLRAILAFLTLLPMVLVRARKNKAYPLKVTLKAGVICGVFLFFACYLQQASIATVEIGKAGFLTAAYIVMVPLINAIATRRSSVKLWVCVAIAMAGLYFLSIAGTYHLEAADAMLLLCALFFSMQILTIDHYSAQADMIGLSCIQFLVMALIGLIPASIDLVQNPPVVSAGAVVSLLYAGILSSGIAYTLQAIGQKGSDPTVASLILSLESVISAISGYFLLHQSLTSREILGCVLMAAAIVLVQLPGKERE